MLGQPRHDSSRVVPTNLVVITLFDGVPTCYVRYSPTYSELYIHNHHPLHCVVRKYAAYICDPLVSLHATRNKCRLSMMHNILRTLSLIIKYLRSTLPA
jgi:hypothetical protein